MISQQRSREAENERQWKQLQAMRQQQAQAAQQQQIMQDQRTQGGILFIEFSICFPIVIHILIFLLIL